MCVTLSLIEYQGMASLSKQRVNKITPIQRAGVVLELTFNVSCRMREILNENHTVHMKELHYVDVILEILSDRINTVVLRNCKAFLLKLKLTKRHR